MEELSPLDTEPAFYFDHVNSIWNRVIYRDKNHYIGLQVTYQHKRDTWDTIRQELLSFPQNPNTASASIATSADSRLIQRCVRANLEPDLAERLLTFDYLSGLPEIVWKAAQRQFQHDRVPYRNLKEAHFSRFFRDYDCPQHDDEEVIDLASALALYPWLEQLLLNDSFTFLQYNVGEGQLTLKRRNPLY